MPTTYLSIPIKNDEGRIVYLRYNLDGSVIEGYRFDLHANWTMLSDKSSEFDVNLLSKLSLESA